MFNQINVQGGVLTREFVLETLSSLGHQSPNLNEDGAFIGRAFRLERLPIVQATGTDRNKSSLICTPLQRQALEEEGLGAGDIIYANRLGLVMQYSLPDLLQNGETMALSVYDPKKLSFAVPKERRRVGLDEMYRAQAPRSFSDALVAIFSPIKQMYG